MELIFHHKAGEKLDKLETEVRDHIWQKLQELGQNRFPRNSDVITVEGREVFKLKLKPDGKDKVDHRVVYDIEGGKIRIYNIFHRDAGYDKQEIASRF